MQTLKTKGFSMRFIRSKQVVEQGQSTETAGARSVPIKFRKPTGWTQRIVHRNSGIKGIDQLQESITQSKLFALGCNDTIHEP